METDEEVYNNALRACSKDYLQTLNMVNKHPLNTFVNNVELRHRVEKPELYDRAGKFNAYKEAPKIHPSMNMFQMASF